METMKKKVTELQETTERLRKDARNAKLREKRAKKTCANLLEELTEKNLINMELEMQLRAYKGI